MSLCFQACFFSSAVTGMGGGRSLAVIDATSFPLFSPCFLNSAALNLYLELPFNL